MSGPRVHVPQRGQGDRSVTRDVPVAALIDDAFEQTDGLAQFPPDAHELRKVQTSDEDAERVIERFGDPDRLVSVPVSLVEHAAFGEGARSSAISSAILRSGILTRPLLSGPKTGRDHPKGSPAACWSLT